MLALWSKLTFFLKKPFTRKRTEQLATLAKIALIKGEEGIDATYIHGPEAEAVLKLAQAASGLIKELPPYEQVVIRAGPLLLVKMNLDGKPVLAVETMSPRLRKILDDNPTLLQNPSLLFSELQKLKAPIRHLTVGIEPQAPVKN